MSQVTEKRCGFVAVVGPPNSGKSTLVNALVGTKVSIVSPKVQTTRSRVLGIALHENSQIVLVDTPGIFAPKKRLERAMVAAAWSGAKDADLIALIVDATRAMRNDEIPGLLKKLRTSGNRLVLILNKIDLIEKPKLPEISRWFNEQCDFEATFMISALKNRGTGELLEFLARAVPEGAWLFDEDTITDMPNRLLAAEITREKIFHLLHQEIPYGIAVHTESWEDFENGQIKIEQTVLVARDNYKGMVVGKGGSMIKRIGEAARLELCEIFETEVHLKLHVKVKENWFENPEQFAILGLEFDV
jgi:GTP-binding protein Era